MFDEFVKDVNEQAVDTSATASEETKTNVTQDAASAETKNTDNDLDVKEGKPIPYDRFREINEKRKAAEAKLKEYESKAEKFKNYEQLDSAMVKDPVLNKSINKIINLYNTGKLTEEEKAEKIDEAIDASKDRYEEKIAKIEDRLNKSEFDEMRKTTGLYMDNFNAMAKKEYSEEKDIKLLEDRVTKIILSKYPNAPREGYRASRLEEAFKEAKDELEGYSKRRAVNYVKEKKADEPPATKTGASVSVEEDFTEKTSRSKAFAAELKAAFRQ